MSEPDLAGRVAALEAEVARLSQPETDAALLERLDRVHPELVRRQANRAAANWPGRSRPTFP